MLYDILIMLMPYSQLLNIILTFFGLKSFLKNNPTKDGLDYAIQEAINRSEKLKN